MKPYGKMQAKVHAFLISTLDGIEWIALRSGRFSAREESSVANLAGNWVGRKTVVVKKNLFSGSRSPVFQSIASHFINWTISVLGMTENRGVVVNTHREILGPETLYLVLSEVFRILSVSSGKCWDGM
jgi:hypothetical protein